MNTAVELFDSADRTAQIFISYRRTDAAGHAGRLFDRLIRQFGNRAVFFDRESIKGGEIFTDRIADAIRASKVVLAAIGPEWLYFRALRGELGLRFFLMAIQIHSSFSLGRRKMFDKSYTLEY